MWARLGCSALAVALVAAFAQPARAQSAEAEALFRDGKRLIKEGKLADGCDKVEASAHIESSPGALLNLGDCREKLGQLSRAWAAFVKCASAAKRDGDAKREAEGKRRASLLEPKLARLTIKVRKRVDGEKIDRDGEDIDPAAWNTDVPVDAGSYKIRATAPGHAAWAGGVTVRDGGAVTIEVPALEPTKTAPVADTPIVSGDEHVDDRRVAAPPSSFTGVRKAAVVVGVAGLAAVAVGGGFAVEAHSHHDSADALCPMTTCGDLHAVQLEHNAQTDAKLANIGFAVGGGVVVAAIVMWLVGGPSASREAVTVVPAAHGTGLAIEGQF